MLVLDSSRWENVKDIVFEAFYSYSRIKQNYAYLR